MARWLAGRETDKIRCSRSISMHYCSQSLMLLLLFSGCCGCFWAVFGLVAGWNHVAHAAGAPAAWANVHTGRHLRVCHHDVGVVHTGDRVQGAALRPGMFATRHMSHLNLCSRRLRLSPATMHLSPWHPRCAGALHSLRVFGEERSQKLSLCFACVPSLTACTLLHKYSAL